MDALRSRRRTGGERRIAAPVPDPKFQTAVTLPTQGRTLAARCARVGADAADKPEHCPIAIIAELLGEMKAMDQPVFLTASASMA